MVSNALIKSVDFLQLAMGSNYDCQTGMYTIISMLGKVTMDGWVVRPAVRSAAEIAG